MSEIKLNAGHIERKKREQMKKDSCVHVRKEMPKIAHGLEWQEASHKLVCSVSHT